ncbi:unnamed protein product [Caenorhabditis brenneri]
MSPTKCVGCRNFVGCLENHSITEIMRIVWHLNQREILQINCDFPLICLLQTGFLQLIPLSKADECRT